MTVSSDSYCENSCLVFDPKHIDFDQPTLWWCLDALDVFAVGENAICKASTASWKDVEESGETLANIVSSFQFVLVCAPPGPGRDEVVEHLTSFLYTPVLVPTEKAFRGCASAGQLKDLGGQKALNGLLFEAKEVPIRGAIHFPARLLKTWPPEQWTMERFQRGKEVWALVEQGRLRESEAAGLLAADADLEHIKNAVGRASLHKILRYLNEGQDARTWRDYLADCVTLGLDLDDRAVLLPKNLEAAHQRTISQIEYKRDPAQWAAFAKRLGGLKKLVWESDGLLIRPPVDAGELVSEGKALNHCVGGYVSGMARGGTTILLIRRTAQPDEPFYTLEWKAGHVVQCRTRNNKSYERDPEVRRFVEAWVERTAKKSRKKGAA